MRKRIGLVILTIGCFGLLFGTAVATLPSGQTLILKARGTVGPIDVKHNGIVLRRTEGRRADVAVATVKFDPGASSGWHHHPGVVLVVVQRGTLTHYNPRCHKRHYSKGDVLVEAGNKPGLVRNNGSVEVVAQATFIVPTQTPAEGLRIDDPQPQGCSAS